MFSGEPNATVSFGERLQPAISIVDAANEKCVGILVPDRQVLSGAPPADTRNATQAGSYEVSVRLEKGDTIGSALQKLGFEAEAIADAVSALAPHIRLKRLPIGLGMTLQIQPSEKEGAKPILIAWMAIYLIMTFYVARWNRGVLPLAAAFAIILLIFSVIAGPEWFARDKTGFTNPPLDESVLGLVTLLMVPVEFLLIAFAMRGFQQEWNVEIERPPDGRPRYDDDEFDSAAARA